MPYSEAILTFVAANVKQYSGLWQESVALYEKGLADRRKALSLRNPSFECRLVSASRLNKDSSYSIKTENPVCPLRHVRARFRQGE